MLPSDRLLAVLAAGIPARARDLVLRLDVVALGASTVVVVHLRVVRSLGVVRRYLGHDAVSFSLRPPPADTGSGAVPGQLGTIATASDVVFRRSYDQVFAFSYSAKWAARADTRAAILSGGERNGSCPTERQAEPRKYHEVGVKLDAEALS